MQCRKKSTKFYVLKFTPAETPELSVVTTQSTPHGGNQQGSNGNNTGSNVMRPTEGQTV